MLRSKQEEDKIISNEIVALKKVFAEGGAPNTRRARECLIRAVYVEMLGHDGGFSYIHAVKLASDTNIMNKRVGLE